MTDNILGILSDDAFAQRMDTLCAIIAKAGTEEDGLGAGTWKDIQRIVRRGLAPKLFSVGDQLRCKRGNETLVWDIIGIDHDIPSDKSMTHSMTLQLHDCFTILRYDTREALYCAESGLDAGTYNFTVGQHTWNPSEKGKTYQFTLTKPVPTGGQLVLSASYSSSLAGTDIMSYTDSFSEDAIETVFLAEGNSGTSLGTMNNTVGGSMNSCQSALLGNNNYAQSSLRQYLGSTAVAGSVWTPQNKFDRPPEWAANTAGFLYGIDENFLAVVGEVDKITVSYGGGSITSSEKIFLLSRSEVYGGDENGINEGQPYSYYVNNSDLSAAGTANDANRIKYRGGKVQHWWLRSPGTDIESYTCYVRYVRNSGDVYNCNSSVYSGVAPVCCII